MFFYTVQKLSFHCDIIEYACANFEKKLRDKQKNFNYQ